VHGLFCIMDVARLAGRLALSTGQALTRHRKLDDKTLSGFHSREISPPSWPVTVARTRRSPNPVLPMGKVNRRSAPLCPGDGR
jgi:hypothetical protein